jgi:aminotransferase
MSLLAARAEALAPSIIREMSGRRRPTSIDLSLGQPSLPPDLEVLARATARLAEVGYGYTDNAGMPELRALIAEHFALPGRQRAENVIVTVGSEEAVFLALMASVDEGAEVLLPEPGYPAYPGIVRSIGAVPVPYRVEASTGFVARADALEALCTERTRAVILNGPSNPFGAIDSVEELARIAALAERRGLVVLSDEIYRELTYQEALPPSICSLTERAIFVSGLSKNCALTGYRLGYLVAEAGFVKQAALLHQLMVTCAPRVAQLAAIEIFREPGRLRAHLPYYAAARARLEEEARGLPADAPLHLGAGAFYAILDVSAYLEGAGPGPSAPVMRLALELLDEEDVVVVPGIAFGPSGGWFWRLSYAAGADLAGEGLRRVARFLGRRAEARRRGG